MSIDTFHITVLEGRHLAAMDKSGTSDPYVTLKTTFNKQSFKTKIIKKTLEPKWNESFAFFTSKAEGSILIKLFDHDRVYKDELMGEVTIPIDQNADGAEHVLTIKLDKEPSRKKKDGQPTGELVVKVWATGSGLKSPSASSAAPAATVAPTAVEAPKPAAAPEPAAPATPPPPRKLERIEDGYTLGKVLGRGAFSVVKSGISKTSGKQHAVKCITKKLIDKKELQLLEREIDIMKKLRHPNIIELTEVVDTADMLYLVLEYASGGELFDAIVNRGNYTEAEAARIIAQILDAIRFCHEHGIAHRDLKPENLLLVDQDGKNDKIKIADFGLSKDFGEEALQTSCGTPDYVAPEVLSGDTYDMSVDVWSIGVICYVLLCGFPPFYGETQKELFENIMSARYDFPDPEWSNISSEAKDFIKKILVVDPSKRYTAEQCLSDAWIKLHASPKVPERELARKETFSMTKFKAYAEQYKKNNASPYSNE